MFNKFFDELWSSEEVDGGKARLAELVPAELRRVFEERLVEYNVMLEELLKTNIALI